MKNLFLLFLFLSAVFRVGKAQDYNFDHFNINHGLSNNTILCSVQDKNGFLWFGTKDGLNRFDGYIFKKYFSDIANKNGLATNYITCLFVDDKNSIWVGTDNGLYRFHAEKDSFEVVKGTQSKEIIEIQQDHNGQLWFIMGYRLFKIDPKLSSYKVDKPLNNKVITALGIDKQGSVWASTHTEIFEINSEKQILFDQIPELKSLSVEVLYFDHDNKVWIGTQHHGLLKADPQNQQIEQIIPYVKNGTKFHVRDIKSNKQNDLWIASESGLIRLNTKTYEWKVFNHERDNPWSISDNAVYSILKDHQGGLWVGSFFGGISYYHQKHNLFERTYPRNNPNSISGYAVREMRADKNGNLWIGTEDNGLNFWNKQTNKFHYYSTHNGLSHHNIHGLEIVGDSLLVGTFNNGLDIISTKTNRKIANYTQQNTKQELGSNFVMSSYKTRNGRIFFSTPNGVFQFIPGKDRFIKIKTVPDSIFYTSIFEDRRGQIWLTTWRDGLYVLDSKLEKIENYKHEVGNNGSITSNRTNRVQQDSNGNIWIATENGLTIWDENGNPVKRFTKSDGLPSNIILAMQEDNHKNMWLSTTNGLIAIAVENLKLSVFNKEFGLSNLQFNYNSALKDDSGNMYFGSTNGLIKFHPDSVLVHRNSETRVPLYVTAVKSSKRDVNVRDYYRWKNTNDLRYSAIQLDYDESTVEIDFAALNYVDASSTSYQYKLKGYDSDWILSRENKAYFTKLPAGQYTLLVKAIDSQGRVISDEILLPIEIKKPFWLSNWAIGLYACATILLIVFVYHFFNERIKNKNRRRLMEINANRERRFYQAKLDFFTQVAHDIKTPLTLIKGPLEKLIDNKNLAEDKADRLLNTMAKNTDKLVRMTNSILDFRRIESKQNVLKVTEVNVSELIEEFIQDYQSSFQVENLILSYHIEPNIVAELDENMIAKIIENLFSNALKYADKFVAIRLYSDLERKSWLLEVKNDGPTLNSREIDMLFKPFYRSTKHSNIEGSGLGLALSHSFALLHEGHLNYVENSEKLNIFVLAIPINLN